MITAVKILINIRINKHKIQIEMFIVISFLTI